MEKIRLNLDFINPLNIFSLKKYGSKSIDPCTAKLFIKWKDIEQRCLVKQMVLINNIGEIRNVEEYVELNDPQNGISNVSLNALMLSTHNLMSTQYSVEVNIDMFDVPKIEDIWLEVEYSDSEPIYPICGMQMHHIIPIRNEFNNQGEIILPPTWLDEELTFKEKKQIPGKPYDIHVFEKYVEITE